MPLASRLRQAACRRQLENHLRHSVPALRLLYARGARSACTRVASAIVQGRLSTTAAWQSAGRDGLFQRLLFIGSRWHRVFLLQKDSLSVVSRKAPPRRLHNLFASDVGRSEEHTSEL